MLTEGYWGPAIVFSCCLNRKNKDPNNKVVNKTDIFKTQDVARKASNEFGWSESGMATIEVTENER